MSRSIFVVGNSTTYANWMQGELAARMCDANLVVFTGGTDVSPALYGKKPHPMTQVPDVTRDAKEKEAFELAFAMKLPMVGICRGAQFLCAMAGGILVQHQRHPAKHKIYTPEGRIIEVTSDHHQCQYPFGMDGKRYELLAWANCLSPFHKGETDAEELDPPSGREAEIVHYPEIRALAIQSHPEWQFPTTNKDDYESVRYHQVLINLLISDAL